MISEYALDPILLAQRFAEASYFFNNAFGVDGRILSQYPKTWTKAVWDAFNQSELGNNQIAKTKFTVLLQKLTQKHCVRRSSSYSEIPNWIERAKREHADRPFRGILATAPPQEHAPTVPIDALWDTGDHELWHGTTSCQPRRQNTPLAAAVAPLLRCAKHIVFVDPYFAPDKKRYTESIPEFIRSAMDKRSVAGVPRIDIVTTITDRNNNLLQGYELSSSLDWLKGECTKRIRPKIDDQIGVFLSVFLEKVGGQEIHNRYILTEIAAIQFGKGLDCELDPASTTCDDLTLLSYDTCQSLWEWYVSGQPKPFDVALDRYLLPDKRLQASHADRSGPL